MKKHFEKYANDIYRVKSDQQLTDHEPGIRTGGYTIIVRESTAQGIHSFVVDWQIPETGKMGGQGDDLKH